MIRKTGICIKCHAQEFLYLLTPWCRILFEKLIVTQHVKKYPFLQNLKVHYHVHTSPQLYHLLNQLNPVAEISLALLNSHISEAGK
jgi:hypothetical protein